MQKTILIPGGAGYIGSHTAYLMQKLGYKIIILDKFIHNQKFDHNWATVIKADFADKNILEQIFTENNIEAVMHFAAFIEVGESVKKPKDFYENNVIKTLNLLDTMLKYNVKKFVFSSSCAVYGNPIKLPLDENHPTNPISPYGKNKLIVEFALQDYFNAYNLQYVSLRYFNAAGALPTIGLGEQHNPETHIIPLILRAIKNKKIFKIFGSNYNTPDKTCIRDYIHVLDIAQAHVLALKYLENTARSNIFNLGTGHGYSVKEMVEHAQKICKQELLIENCDARAGDVDILVANYNKAKENLGWEPKFSSLDNILQSALEWENRIK
ncbi:UDP-glucose 4-epimerase GalE [Candidatus Babeliales bacterium]|nr:UDP-glucose 4-epimerase GalE [Candidatus Babeliales bacterium]MCF7899357.1 UDP-glucose 4-epimerase GalE [Candidatus Babeliales bacterium]